MNKVTSLLTKVLAFYFIFPPAPVRGTDPVGFKGSIEIGFDSFMEKYSIVEEDTLDQLTEFRTRINLGYFRGYHLKNFLNVEGQVVGGSNMFDGGGKFSLAGSSETLRFGTDVEGMVRRYRSNSTYAFPNDYTRYSTRTYIQKLLASTFSLRLLNRLEGINFDERTEFDYDYWRNSIYLSGDLESSFFTLFHASLGYTYKSIPDTTEISYKSYSTHIDFHKYLGLFKHISISLDAERRLYAHKPIKSPFWMISANVSLAPLANGSFGVVLENALEGYIYDTNSDVYFSYAENRSALLFSYTESLGFQARAGPAYAIFASEPSREDRYQEIGGKLELEYYNGAKIWLSLSYEPGRRFYQIQFEDDSEIIFSDYTFNRLILFITSRIRSCLSANCFLNYEPEYHERKGDDTTITLLSLSLTYEF